MKTVKPELSLDRPAACEIRLPGHLDESWSDLTAGMTTTVEPEGNGPPVTILTVTLDQAASHDLLRRLYSLGLPLLSVGRVKVEEQESDLKGVQK